MFALHSKLLTAESPLNRNHFIICPCLVTTRFLSSRAYAAQTCVNCVHWQWRWKNKTPLFQRVALKRQQIKKITSQVTSWWRENKTTTNNKEHLFWGNAVWGDFCILKVYHSGTRTQKTKLNSLLKMTQSSSCLMNKQMTNKWVKYNCRFLSRMLGFSKNNINTVRAYAFQQSPRWFHTYM